MPIPPDVISASLAKIGEDMEVGADDARLMVHTAYLLGASLRFHIFDYGVEVGRASVHLREAIVAKGFELGRAIAARVIEVLNIGQVLVKSQGITQLNAVAVSAFYARATMAPNLEAATNVSVRIKI